MFKSGALAACAIASMVAVGGLSATSTSAEAGWRKGYGHAHGYRYAGPRGHYYNRHRGRNIGLGIAGGLLAVGALAAITAPAYAGPSYARPSYGYQPSYGYAQPVYYAPRCVIRHRTVWDQHYGYVSQPVRVCH